MRVQMRISFQVFNHMGEELVRRFIVHFVLGKRSLEKAKRVIVRKPTYDFRNGPDLHHDDPF